MNVVSCDRFLNFSPSVLFRPEDLFQKPLSATKSISHFCLHRTPSISTMNVQYHSLVFHNGDGTGDET